MLRRLSRELTVNVQLDVAASALCMPFTVPPVVFHTQCQVYFGMITLKPYSPFLFTTIAPNTYHAEPTFVLLRGPHTSSIRYMPDLSMAPSQALENDY